MLSAGTRGRCPPTSWTRRPASCTALSDGQRNHDLQIAEENLAGELADVSAEVGRPLETPPEETAAELVLRYERLWEEPVHDELFGPDERYRLHERLHRLNGSSASTWRRWSSSPPTRATGYGCIRAWSSPATTVAGC